MVQPALSFLRGKNAIENQWEIVYNRLVNVKAIF